MPDVDVAQLRAVIQQRRVEQVELVGIGAGLPEIVRWLDGDLAILDEHMPVKATSERRWSIGSSCVICDHGFPDWPCPTVRIIAGKYLIEEAE